jgi:hypothetical protein
MQSSEYLFQSRNEYNLLLSSMDKHNSKQVIVEEIELDFEPSFFKLNMPTIPDKRFGSFNDWDHDQMLNNSHE